MTSYPAMIRLLTLLLLFATPALWGQGNGKLQLHFIDVGQGNGALLITPGGKVALFDAGIDINVDNCDKLKSYLDGAGITQIDAVIVSHYHTDHIGCLPEVLEGRTLAGPVYDRGQSYNTATYRRYEAAVRAKRTTATPGQTITLEATPRAVTLQVIAINGAGVSTTNENDLSLAVRLSYGAFRAEIGGDLSGEKTDDYEDIETFVAADAGRLDVYKVHHHCSKYSTNDMWLRTTTPTVGIISTGDTNTYGHPASACLDRLHQSGTKLYWTERGNGGSPTQGIDKIGKNILVEVGTPTTAYTVQFGATKDPFQTRLRTETALPSPVVAARFAWSSGRSKVYHDRTCPWVNNINPENLQRGDTPPPGRTKHDCPAHP